MGSCFGVSLWPLSLPSTLQFSTPLEKLYCFKKCIVVLTEMPLRGTYEGTVQSMLV